MADCRLWISEWVDYQCVARSYDCIPKSESGFTMADCGMRISECIEYQGVTKSQNHDSKSEMAFGKRHHIYIGVGIPKSEIHLPKSSLLVQGLKQVFQKPEQKFKKKHG